MKLSGIIKKTSVYGMLFILASIIFLANLFEVNSFAQNNFPAENDYEINDSHFHLTNYIQEGTDIHKFLDIMGSKVGRVALFGVPLQQQWSYQISGEHAPKYYLDTDAPLYYYSFTDAYIATVYKSLSKEQQYRFDPMITGFNPADMYAVDHIRRVLLTFPGVFSGIGEFSIHKEFVSSKVAGETASLLNPSLDSILHFAKEAGLVVLIHNDIDIPFAKEGQEPMYLQQMKSLLKRHSQTTIIWAHIGLGRVIRPVKDNSGAPERNQNQIELIKEILKDPALEHVSFDISWSEVAKYIVRNDSTVNATAELINSYPNRFLFGTDEVAPNNQEQYLKIFYQYEPLWKALSREAKDKVCKENYLRIFDEARKKVREWEKKHQ